MFLRLGHVHAHVTPPHYTFVLKNRVAIVIKSVLINAYLFALILISIRVFILSLLLLIVYRKVKESPLSN
jgi:hypothetical protein